MQWHFRPASFLVLTLAAFSACMDASNRLLAPEKASFVQSPDAPVVNTVNDVVDEDGCTAAHCSLREAIHFASAGATITFSVTGTILLTHGDLLIEQDLTITGPGPANLTVSGNNASRVFYIDLGTTASLSGLTITGGSAQIGGGIFNEGTLTLTNSTVSGNRASSEGGGILNWGTLTIENSTISGNRAEFDGGGIVSEGTLTLANCVVSNNRALEFGGGIHTFGKLTITDCTISGNVAEFGGGIYGGATVYDSRITGNRARVGGGIDGGGELVRTIVSGNEAWMDGGGIYGRVTLLHSTVSGNTAIFYGGGIYSEVGRDYVNSTIVGNSAEQGGGIYGGGTVRNSLVARNEAEDDGGGIYGSVSLVNSTVSGNTAQRGGGIRNEGVGTYVNSTIVGNLGSFKGGGIFGGGTLLNTLVAGNEATEDEAADLLHERARTLTATHSLIGSSQGHSLTHGVSGNIVLDPGDELGLGPLANNGGPTRTHALLPGSPALDAGTSEGCPAEDQRGIPRPQGAACDIGAFELEVSPPPPALHPSGEGSRMEPRGVGRNDPARGFAGVPGGPRRGGIPRSARPGGGCTHRRDMGERHPRPQVLPSGSEPGRQA